MNFRKFKSGNEEALISYLNNENVTKYLSSRIPQPYTLDDAIWWINEGCKIGVVRVIEVEDKLVGTVGVRFGENEHSRSAEIGYWLGEEYWGKGFCTEAVCKMTETIFSTTEIVRLYAPVFSPNTASMRVLEKAGYKLEGIHIKEIFKNGENLNQHLFARIKS